MALAHVIRSLSVQIKPVSRIATFGTVFVHETRLGRDQENAVSRQTGAEIDVFRETGTPEIFVKPQPTNLVGPEAHQPAAELPNLYRPTAPEFLSVVINILALVMKRA